MIVTLSHLALDMWVRVSGVVCDREGVCSEGDVQYATAEARYKEGLDVELVPKSAAGRDSPVGFTLGDNHELVEKLGSIDGEHGVVFPAGAILGSVGAAVALVIGSVKDSARKVKSVNSLVEALGSPAQQRVLVAARSMRGRDRPTKGNYPWRQLLNDDRNWGPRPFRFLNCWLDCKDTVRCFGVEWLQLVELGVGTEFWLSYGG
ncbi:hypothetical protein V6N12_068928 [Hibiscus sabdariffa]|uniref:Uncharacterized protein n=1 Tax=Hibiscus sabdariffa TaxID=183260 RepID=A0ABR2CA79_9ROSI